MNRMTVCLVVSIAAVLNAPISGADDRLPEIRLQQPGVTLDLIAEHPQLMTPTGIDVDQQGRIWVVATHTHFRPDDYEGPVHDEVIIFKSEPGEQTADHQVFWNSTDATMDLELGPDGWVYLAERDRVLRVRDSDGDGRGDQTEDLVTLETEAVYPHNGLEGLAWHPGGDLIFGLGENFAKPWTLTGVDGTSLSGTGEGGIFCCASDGSQLRRIAHGFWNPFGICVREDGEIFATDNDPGERPPCRLLHVVEGGDYGYQRAYGSEAHHPFVAWNGELRGTLPMIHPTGEAPCGVVPFGRGLIVPSWSDHRIDFFRLKRQGASYSAERVQMVSGSRYFRPGCIAADPRSEGTRRVWYFTDWVDGRYQAHGYGRLWKLTVNADEAPWVGPLDPEPPNEAQQAYARLREHGTQHSTDALLRQARTSDPFYAHAALIALSSQAESWNPERIAGWSDSHRVSAVLALSFSSVPPDQWIPTLLRDENPDVLFETLRWISNSQLKDYLPQVEQLLSRPDLDYRVFEAGIATWNTLNGKSEDGVRNPAMLLAKLKDPTSSPRLKAYSLRLLPTQARSAPKDGSTPQRQFPEGLTLDFLESLLVVGDELLSLEVVRTLAESPVVAEKVLIRIATDEGRDAALRAEAIAGLASTAERHATLLLQLAGSSQQAVREEALRGLRAGTLSDDNRQSLQAAASRFPESVDLFNSVLKPATTDTKRPAVSDTQAWLNALDRVAVPVDVESGRRIFHGVHSGRCATCHRHGGRGNVVGPDLSGQGSRGDRLSLLQAILEPSRQMDPEYQPRIMVLSDGRTVTGIRLRSSTSEVLRDANGQNISFNRDEIDSIVESNVSFMPTGLADALTMRELRDLLAFLQQP